MTAVTELITKAVTSLQDIIGTDAGGRGMKSLVLPGDLQQASRVLAELPSTSSSHVVVLSGFPCMVEKHPPTETDGPPGAVALCRASRELGHAVTLVTDDCNAGVFQAALEGTEGVSFEAFPSVMSKADYERLELLGASCDLVLACERAGPASDGHCYTMRGIDMTAKGLIAPVHRLVEAKRVPFLAIGDGGNELGMGKVLDVIKEKIPKGETIGCAIAADYLVAASVSNWGGYALAAGAAVTRAGAECNDDESVFAERVKVWVERCLPTEEEEIALLDRCVAKGCRDGVSGNVEATVDGLPLERSMQCLRDIREESLAAATRR